jgi:hypothetical protein
MDNKVHADAAEPVLFNRAFFSGLGTFIQNASNLNSFSIGLLANIDLNIITQVIGISFIGYALYIIVKSFYK